MDLALPEEVQLQLQSFEVRRLLHTLQKLRCKLQRAKPVKPPVPAACTPAEPAGLAGGQAAAVCRTDSQGLAIKGARSMHAGPWSAGGGAAAACPSCYSVFLRSRLFHHCCFVQLEPLERSQAQLAVAHAAHRLLQLYLQTCGVDPAGHESRKEQARAHSCLARDSVRAVAGSPASFISWDAWQAGQQDRLHAARAERQRSAIFVQRTED